MNTASALPPTDTAASRLAAVSERIRQACVAAGGPPASVSLLAVSKTWEAARVLELAALGQHAFGENYLQESLAKIAACEAAGAGTIEWHFIGPIQSNKTRPIAEHFHWVHSVDREKIAARLSEQRPAGSKALQVCVQVNVSGEASKSGCEPSEALSLALAVARMPGLQLRGLMTIPEPTSDPDLQRQRFATLRELFDRVRMSLAAQGMEASRFDTLSMGMSDDLEAAIAEGATLVRVGTALFGRRLAQLRPSP